MEEIKKFSVSRRNFVAGSAAAAAAVSLGLAGCSSGGSSSSSTSSSSTSSNSGSGELTAAVAYETKNYHPSTTSSALALGANWHVVEGLYELNMSTYKPYAALAAGDPTEVTSTQFEVTLRTDAKFSDGTAVTAADVVASYERANKADGLYAPMLSWISAVSAKDDKTVVIDLAFPFSLVKERLSLIKVVPAGASDDELTSKPVGTGPWMYDSITEKQISFAPNTNYNGNYAAKDGSMTWQIIKDDTARTTAMTEATVSVMESVPAENSDMVTAAGATVDDVQGFNQAFLMFNTKKAPFDDYRVRQAFHYAIDTDKLISNALSGKAEKVTCFLPKDHANYHEAATVFTYDQDKAKSLLEEAGVSGLSITLDSTDAGWITALAPQIKNDLDAIGISVEVASQASSSLYSNVCDVDDPTFDVVLAPGDPSVFGNDPDLLMNWWYGDNSWTKKRTGWKGSDKYTELHEYMQAAVESSDSKEQQSEWNKCFDLLAEQCPLYPLFHRKMATGYYETKITGYTPIGTTGLNFIGASTK